jgi:flagellar basal body P-ring formation protein FlgA
MKFLIKTVVMMNLLAAPVTAQNLILQSQPHDQDGQVTLGEVFSNLESLNASDKAEIVIAQRQTSNVVLDAGRVQNLVQSLGLYWDNPQGVRNIIVRGNTSATGPRQSAQNKTLAPDRNLNSPLSAVAQVEKAVETPMVIRRAEPVTVIWRSPAMSLSMTGVAMRDAGLGQVIGVQNPQSKKIIDAIVTGPGHATALNSDAQQSLAWR